MRIPFTSISRPKKAAQHLARYLPGLPLARAQLAVAKAAGYTDWHEIERTLQPPDDIPQTAPDFDQSLSTFLSQVSVISDLTGFGTGEVQYALSRTHLNGVIRWTLEDHITARLRFWRNSGALPLGRYVPGSVVQVTGNGRDEIGYLCTYAQPSRALLDGGTALRADFELIAPDVPLPDFLPSYLWVPYGYWTLVDGSVVAFSREYMPLWHIYADGITRLPPWLWVEQIVDEYRFSDRTSKRWNDPLIRPIAIDWLAAKGVTGLPVLADALPLFIGSVDANIRDIVGMMHSKKTAPDPLGPWDVSGMVV